MIKAEFFFEYDFADLQEDMNKFLAKLSYDQFLDLQFTSHVIDYTKDINSTYFYAIIIYKERKG